MNRIYLLAITMCAIQSCCKQYTAGLQVNRQQSDSTTIVERLRTDTVSIPGDTIIIEMPLWKDCVAMSQTPVLTQVKGKRSKAVAELKPDGKLKLTLNCDEYRTALIARDSIIKRMYSDKQSSAEVKVIERKHIPQLFWYSMVFSCCALVWWLAKFAMWAYGKWPL